MRSIQSPKSLAAENREKLLHFAVDRQLIADYLEQIASCGPRAVGSSGERKVAEFVAGRFSGNGLMVVRQKVSVSRWPFIVMTKWVPLAAASFLILAGGMYLLDPFLTVFPLAVLLGTIPFIRRWHRLTRRLFDMGNQLVSVNIVAHTKPFRSKATTLVFLAHHDSKSQSLPIILRFFLLYLSIAAVGSLLSLTTLAEAGVVSPSSTVVWFLGSIATVSLLIQALNRSGNRSPGGLDNASGLAILMALAKHLPRTVSNKVNLMFVATGAEELGMGGALRFVQHYGAQLPRDRTLCFNFDALGCGHRLYLVGSKEPFERVAAELVEMLGRRGLRTRRIPMPLGAGMDHIPLAEHGLWALSLTQAPSQASLWIHSRRDRFDRVNASSLATVVSVGIELAKSVCNRCCPP